EFEKTGVKTYRITGDLTMLGVTKPLTVTATRVAVTVRGFVTPSMVRSPVIRYVFTPVFSNS
ncbi:hypothetical protein D3OALGB2SA_2520, partial [Olavius algarvensis associated proteobacterium Delta 3]